MTEERLDLLLRELGARLFQQAWIVEDRSAAEAAMQGALGCSDFVDLEMDQEWTYRGRQVSCVLALGFARSANTQIELMQPLRGESFPVEFLKPHGSGPHHFGCLVADLEAPIAVADRSG